jgi:hypothetical protein
MARLILPFLVAFLVAIAGSSAAMLVRARDAHSAALTKAIAAKAKTDSVKATTPAVEHADSAKVDAPRVEAPAPTPIALPASSARGEASAPTLVTKIEDKPGIAARAPEAAKPSALPAAVAKPAVGDAAAPGASERRLAKIFSSMAPKDAAKVLQNMDDGDVKIILGYLGSRQAAAILGAFPTARAAELSRQALKSSPPTSGAKE